MKLKEIFLAGILCAFSVTGSSSLADDKALKMSEDELIAAAEKMLEQEAEGRTSEKVETKAEQVSEKRVLKESEIPAFKTAQSPKAIEETGSWKRVVFSSIVVLVLSVGLFFGVQRYAKKTSTQSSKLKMDVIAQHHFSPKRSLIVVRIAGEHLLIGATDHSMNLIKTISLIDDEADGLPQDFNNFLEDEFVEKRTISV